MGKGDQDFAQSETARLGKQAGDNLSNTQSNVNNNLNTMTGQFQSPYLNSVNQQGNNYNEIMNGYRNFLSRGSFGQNGNYMGNTVPGGAGGNGPIVHFPMPDSGDNSGTPRIGKMNIDPGVGGFGGYDPNSGNLQGNPLGIAGGGFTGGMFPPGSLQVAQNNWNANNGGNQSPPIYNMPSGGYAPGGMGSIYSGGAQNPTQGSPSSNGEPADYQSIYSQIMGGANDQASLLRNAPQLRAAGFQISPANASGEITKVGIPDGNGGTQWVRVIGNGEGHPVWIPQNNSGAMSGGGSFDPGIADAMRGYGDFAVTGGFSPQDITDMRARSAAPIRGIYNQAQQDLQRSKSLNNGVSPNYAAASSQMNRDMSNNIANQLQSTDASIAGMRQQGRLSGLSGLSQTGLLGRGQDLSNYQTLRGQDLQNAQIGRTQDLSAIQGMGNLYGTAPGAAGMYGNQYLQAGLGGAGNQINLAQLLNQLNLGLIGATQTNATIPTTAQNVLNNISWGVNTAGKVGSMIGGMA